jgi:hypothetical protein
VIVAWVVGQHTGRPGYTSAAVRGQRGTGGASQDGWPGS